MFVDQRGTGGSNPLNCDFFNPADPQSYLGYFFPVADVRKCREQLETRADLTLYTTTIAVDDLDEIRAALGYELLNLFGASYGTRAALVYLKRHPEHVRTVTLQGVSPTNHHMPGDFPRQTERALQGVLSECATDEACSKTFSKLNVEAKAVLAQLLKGPVEVELRNSTAADRIRVKLSRDLAAEAIRYMLYSLQIVVPHGAHGLGGLEGVECINRLNTEFVERGAVKGLDTSCVRAIRRKGFALK